MGFEKDNFAIMKANSVTFLNLTLPDVPFLTIGLRGEQIYIVRERTHTFEINGFDKSNG